MKRWMKFALAGLVVLLLASGVLRALSARKAQQAAVATQSAATTQSVIRLEPTDLASASVQTLQRMLPVSGTLKAVESAFVKARVAGELQGLSVREGDAVNSGQLLGRIDPTEYAARLRQAVQQADAAKAQIDIAQRQFDNNKALVNQGFISKTALEASEANLNAARGSHQAAEAAADVARKALADTELRAPISGWVAQRLAQSGERLAIDARVVEIVNLSRLEVELALSAADSLSVRLGQTARLQVEGSDRVVQARVARINPSAQAGSRSVLVYLAVADSAGLRQGLFAQGQLSLGEAQALTVPLSAVRTDKPQPYVQVVEQQQVAHKTVTLGEQGLVQGQTMVAVTGLEPQTPVLAGSVGPLRVGTAVQINTPTR